MSVKTSGTTSKLDAALISAWAAYDAAYESGEPAFSAFRKAYAAAMTATPSEIEGPFTYASGWSGYYDPTEGCYLGTDDIYMPVDFDPSA